MIFTGFPYMEEAGPADKSANVKLGSDVSWTRVNSASGTVDGDATGEGSWPVTGINVELSDFDVDMQYIIHADDVTELAGDSLRMTVHVRDGVGGDIEYTEDVESGSAGTISISTITVDIDLIATVAEVEVIFEQVAPA